MNNQKEYLFACSILFNGHVGAACLAGIAVGLCIDSADWLILESTDAFDLRRAGALVGENLVLKAFQLTTILVGDTVLGTSGFVKIGTFNEHAIQRTRSLTFYTHAFAVSLILVGISYAIDAADWGEYLWNGTVWSGGTDSRT